LIGTAPSGPRSVTVFVDIDLAAIAFSTCKSIDALGEITIPWKASFVFAEEELTDSTLAVAEVCVSAE